MSHDLDAIVRGIARFGMPSTVGVGVGVLGPQPYEEPDEASSGLIAKAPGGQVPGGQAPGEQTPVGPDQPRIVDEPLPEDVWARVLGTSLQLRLLGFLVAAIETGAFAVTESQWREAIDRHLERSASMLYLERRLVEVVDLLATVDVEVVVLKGTAHAHLLYPYPGWRTFGDTDLLLRGDDFDRAIRTLETAGYARPVPSARPGFDARFGKGATLVGRERDELDLHRTLLFGTFGFRIDNDLLFDTAIDVEVEGRHLRALGPETRILHLCYHAGLGDPIPQLAGIRDLAQALALGAHDDTEVLRLARAWDAVAVLVRAFGLCRTHLGVEVEGPLADAARLHVPTRRELRAIDSYVGDNRRFAAKAVASLPYLDGAGERLAFLRAAVLPDRTMLEAQGSAGYGAWFVRGVRALTRGGRR